MKNENPCQYLARHNMNGDITRMVMIDYYLECCKQGLFEEPAKNLIQGPKVHYDPSIKDAPCGSRSRLNKG
jgi:hypothetical protein